MKLLNKSKLVAENFTNFNILFNIRKCKVIFYYF